MESYGRAYRDPKSPLTPISPFGNTEIFNFNLHSNDGSLNTMINNVKYRASETPKQLTVYQTASHQTSCQCMKSGLTVQKTAGYSQYLTVSPKNTTCVATKNTTCVASKNTTCVASKNTTCVSRSSSVSPKNTTCVSRSSSVSPRNTTSVSPINTTSVSPRNTTCVSRSSSVSPQITTYTSRCSSVSPGNSTCVRNTTAINTSTTRCSHKSPGTTTVIKNSCCSKTCKKRSTENQLVPLNSNYKMASPVSTPALSPIILQLLAAFGLLHLKKLFEEQEIDMSILTTMTDRDFRAMGIHSSADISQITKAVFTTGLKSKLK